MGKDPKIHFNYISTSPYLRIKFLINPKGGVDKVTVLAMAVNPHKCSHTFQHIPEVRDIFEPD